MIIDPTSLAYMQAVIKTADIVKIHNIIIEPGRVRAIDDEKTVVIFQNKDVPVMPFGSIGINRIDVFSSRIDIIKAMESFSIEAVVESTAAKDPFVRALLMKGKGIKVDYRCANPATIQAPKVINDSAIYSIKITPEAVALMQKGQSAMNTDEITFVGTDAGVSFEMADINCDKMVYHFADNVKIIGDATAVVFSRKYPIKTLHSLFKATSTGEFEITAKGMLKIVVNGLDVYVLARE